MGVEGEVVGLGVVVVGLVVEVFCFLFEVAMGVLELFYI